MSKTFKSEGVVIRSLKYSETSLILDIYTEMHGMGSYIVSGVRKARSSVINMYHPMNIIDMVAYNPGDKLTRIKEASFAYKYEQLNLGVVRSAIGTYFVDLIRSSIKEKEANLELFKFIKSTLIELDTSSRLSMLPITYAFQLATHLGFQISGNYSDAEPYFDLQSGEFTDNDVRHEYILNDSISKSLFIALNEGLEANLGKLERKLVLDALMKYYRLHVEEFNELRSLPVLRTILS